MHLKQRAEAADGTLTLQLPPTQQPALKTRLVPAPQAPAPSASPRPTASSVAGSHFGCHRLLPALLLARALCVANNSHLPGAMQRLRHTSRRLPPHTQGSTEVASRGTGTTEPGRPERDLGNQRTLRPCAALRPSDSESVSQASAWGVWPQSGLTRRGRQRGRPHGAHWTGCTFCSRACSSALRPRARERMRQDPRPARG